MSSPYTAAVAASQLSTAAAAAPGVGKTHLAIGLAIACAQSGRRVYYGTLAEELLDSLDFG